jgi:hypothetical protein
MNVKPANFVAAHTDDLVRYRTYRIERFFGFRQKRGFVLEVSVGTVNADPVGSLGHAEESAALPAA